jgi:chromosome segregation ATPase
MSKTLEDKIDKLDSRIDSIDKTLERNTVSLEVHMKRSDMLEEYVQKIEAEVKPVKEHVYKMTHAIQGIFWFCAVLASVAGFIFVLKQLGLF